jgi:hypothetical protein
MTDLEDFVLSIKRTRWNRIGGKVRRKQYAFKSPPSSIAHGLNEGSSKQKDDYVSGGAGNVTTSRSKRRST